MRIASARSRPANRLRAPGRCSNRSKRVGSPGSSQSARATGRARGTERVMVAKRAARLATGSASARRGLPNPHCRQLQRPRA
eukprot:3532345-Alexandrium_andersonii.AAC.1